MLLSILDKLWWGQHHFPKRCLITKEAFEAIVQTANKILSEKSVDPSLAAVFDYYVKLYHIYFAWKENGENSDFYELCDSEGIEYEKPIAVYYQK